MDLRYLIFIGIILVFIGIAFTIVGSLFGAKMDKSNTKFAVAGFIGPIPFGFGNNKQMLIFAIIFSIIIIILFFVLHYFMR